MTISAICGDRWGTERAEIGRREEIAAIRSRLREAIPDLFNAGRNVQYDANTNTVSAADGPGSEAQEQLSRTFGG